VKPRPDGLGIGPVRLENEVENLAGYGDVSLWLPHERLCVAARLLSVKHVLRRPLANRLPSGYGLTRNMAKLETLADRVWYAIHCLPRDRSGAVPAYRQLERDFNLPDCVLHKTIVQGRTQVQHETFRNMAKALRVSDEWLDGRSNKHPVPTGYVPPRPGTTFRFYGDLPNWKECVDADKHSQRRRLPDEYYEAGAKLPLTRPIGEATREIARRVSQLAWELAEPAEQTRYTSAESKAPAPPAQQTPKDRPQARAKKVGRER
jgi:hypothetical protein